MRVPEETCLVGCDAAVWHSPGSPIITCVDVSWHSAGEMAVRKMFELREKGESSFENIKLPPCIRKGDTCPSGEQN